MRQMDDTIRDITTGSRAGDGEDTHSALRQWVAESGVGTSISGTQRAEQAKRRQTADVDHAINQETTRRTNSDNRVNKSVEYSIH